MTAPAPWVAALHSAARRRVPLVLVLRDGSSVRGLVGELGISFAVIEGRRVELANVEDCTRIDGRRWTAGREVRT